MTPSPSPEWQEESRVKLSTVSATPAPTAVDALIGREPVCFAVETPTPFAFSPDGSLLYLRSRSAVEIYDISAGMLVRKIEAGGDLLAATLSTDGAWLAWSLADSRIQRISVDSGDAVATYAGHTEPALDLCFSVDSERLYSASHDGWVRVWALDGSSLPSIQVGGEVLGFGLSADGRWLATVPSDGPVLLWDMVDGSLAAELGGTGGYDTSDVAFSADDRYLVADLATGLYLWSLADRQLLWNDVRNSMAASFAPGDLLLTYPDVDQDNQVILASADAQQVLGTLERQRGPVWALFFSVDGSLLAVSDGVTVEVWRPENGSLVAVGKMDCP